MPGSGRVPGIGDAMKLMQIQSEIMAELPSTIADLQSSVKSLAEVLAQTRDTVASAQRVSTRLESVLDELEEPLRALRPGLERLAVTLSDPVLDRIPDSLRAIEATVLPVNDSVQRIRGIAHRIARPGWGRRLR